MSSGSETAPIFGEVISPTMPPAGAAAPETNGAQGATTEKERAAPEHDIETVLFAAADPLHLDAISAEANAMEGKPHLAAGKIEAVLNALLEKGRVVRTEQGDPKRAHYAVAPAVREEVEAPGRTRDARAAVLAFVAHRTTYLPIESGEPPERVDTLTAADVAHGLWRANLDEGMKLDADLVEAFVRGRRDGSEETANLLIEEAQTILRALVGHGLLTSTASDANTDAGYALTKEALAKLVEEGALALAQTTLPPSAPEILWDQRETELNASWSAQVKEEIARTEAAEKKRNEALEVNTILLRWFQEKGIPDPVSMVRATLKSPLPDKVFMWSSTVEMEGAELLRVLDEMRSLRALIEQRTEKIAADKKAGQATVELLQIRYDTLREAAEDRGRRTVHKQAWSRIITIDGKPMREILSADEHDRDTRLAIEDLAPGTQIGIPGAAAGGTPVAASPSASPVLTSPATETKTADLHAAAESLKAAVTNLPPEMEDAASKEARQADEQKAAAASSLARPPGSPQLVLRPKEARAFLVEHLFPRHPDGIPLKDVPRAAFELAGLMLTPEATEAGHALLTKVANIAREKGDLEEVLLPEGPVLKLPAKADPPAQTSLLPTGAEEKAPASAEKPPTEKKRKDKGEGKRAGKAKAGTA